MALPTYNNCLSDSPFREPLAKYLDGHFASKYIFLSVVFILELEYSRCLFTTGAASFFLQEHRLCNPVYSNLFKDILQRDDCVLLRNYLSNNSTLLLNVCFDRPIHIIRSEKLSGHGGKVAVYGINEWSSPSTQRKLEVARHEIELKSRSLSIKKQDESRSQKALLSKSDDSNFSEYQHQLLIARESMERAKRELREARNAYSSIVSQVSNKGCASGKTMTITALELQHQGFEIIKILAFINPEYIWSQNDIVRALRWLWRSRGRHYRLLHEEEIPPRYHCESRALGQFLVSYSKANPTDIDVLFDLIRIFVSLSSP